MGTEPVWKSHAFLMVSDGGSPFHAQGPPGLLRSMTVNSNQARALLAPLASSHSSIRKTRMACSGESARKWEGIPPAQP